MNHILSEFSQNYLPKRHSFILRLWQNNYDADWLIMVQEMDGEIVTFANLDELMAFLMEKMPASSPVKPYKLRWSDFAIAGICALFATLLFSFWLILSDMSIDWAQFNVPIIRSTILSLGLGIFELIIGAALYFGFYHSENEVFLQWRTSL